MIDLHRKTSEIVAMTSLNDVSYFSPALLIAHDRLHSSLRTDFPVRARFA